MTPQLTDIILCNLIETAALFFRIKKTDFHVPRALAVAVSLLLSGGLTLLDDYMHIYNLGSPAEQLLISAAGVFSLPLIFALCVDNWLGCLAEMHLYIIVFSSLPMALAAVVLSGVLAPDSFAQAFVSNALLAVFQTLSVIFYRKRLFGSVSRAVSVPLYIFWFWIVYLIIAVTDWSDSGAGFNRSMFPVILFSLAVPLIALLIMPSLLRKSAESRRAALRASVNGDICAQLSKSGETAGKLRHDLANHIQTATSDDSAAAVKYGERIAAMASGYIAEKLTESREINVLFRQLRLMLEEKGKTLEISWQRSEAVNSAFADRLLDIVTEKLCDVLYSDDADGLRVSVDGDAITCTCTERSA